MSSNAQGNFGEVVNRICACLSQRGVKGDDTLRRWLLEVVTLCSDIHPSLMESHFSRVRHPEIYLRDFNRPDEIAEHFHLLAEVTKQMKVTASVRAIETDPLDSMPTYDIVVAGIDGPGVAHAIAGCLKDLTFDITEMRVVTYERPKKSATVDTSARYIIAFRVMTDERRKMPADVAVRKLRQKLRRAYRLLDQGKKQKESTRRLKRTGKNSPPDPAAFVERFLSRNPLMRCLLRDLKQVHQMGQALEHRQYDRAAKLAAPLAAGEGARLEVYAEVVALVAQTYLHTEDGQAAEVIELELIHIASFKALVRYISPLPLTSKPTLQDNPSSTGTPGGAPDLPGSEAEMPDKSRSSNGGPERKRAGLDRAEGQASTPSRVQAFGQQGRQRIGDLLQSRFFGALSDPTRVTILDHLVEAGSPQTVSQIAKGCPVDYSVVCRHLKDLRAAEIVAATKRGREVFYSVLSQDIARKLRALADILEPQTDQ